MKIPRKDSMAYQIMLYLSGANKPMAEDVIVNRFRRLTTTSKAVCVTVISQLVVDSCLSRKDDGRYALTCDAKSYLRTQRPSVLMAAKAAEMKEECPPFKPLKNYERSLRHRDSDQPRISLMTLDSPINPNK